LGFDYEIEFRSGKENIAVDALSSISNNELHALTLSTIEASVLENIKQLWQEDNRIQAIIQDLIRDPATHPHYKMKQQLPFQKRQIDGGTQSNSPASTHFHVS